MLLTQSINSIGGILSGPALDFDKLIRALNTSPKPIDSVPKSTG